MSVRLRRQLARVGVTTGVVAMWTCVHFASVRVYDEVCLPRSLTAAIVSPFVIGAPHCTTLRWVIAWSGFEGPATMLTLGSILCPLFTLV